MGQRDDVLFRYACSWRERQYPLDHARALMQVLHSRCEQKPGDPFTVKEAMAKLDHAWTSYKKPSASPKSDWTQVINSESNQTFDARRHEVASITNALERFVFVEAGNRVVDLNRHPTYAVFGLEEFKNSFKKVWIGEAQLPTKWLANRNRKTVRDTIYWPNAKRITSHNKESFYNTYMKANQQLPEVVEQNKLDIFTDHMHYLFSDKESYDRMLNWIAMTVQKPEIRVPWLPLIISDPGCGKGWLYLVMRQLLGPHNCAMIRNKDIESAYNGYMSGTTLVCMDDLINNKKVQIVEVISPLITESELMINHKYGGNGIERIFCNFLGFTNNNDAVAVQLKDRRFWVYQVTAKQQTPEYYTELFNWLKTDGPAHLEVWIRSLDISKFQYAAPPPITEAKRVMVSSSRGAMEQLIRDCIEDHTGVFQCDILDATLVEAFLTVHGGVDRLTQRDINEVHRIFSTLSFKLPQERYRVPLESANSLKNKRYRLRSIRNAERWNDANPNDIAEEYRRAWLISAGRDTGAQLKEARGE